MPPTPPIDPQHWPRVQALFQQALELPPERRAAFVAGEESDPEVRELVTRMLEADLDTGLDPRWRRRGAARRYRPTPPDPETPDPMLGRTVGPWRIVERLGQGGMGTVYLAEHGELGHQVALKVIRPGMHSAGIVQRFEQERQIVASLSHPNVARLFDGGLTDDGLPWFSMELVRGEPIDRWCERRQLGLRDRLALFGSVCDAVQYAHARLVVHRDLKPGNIFVGDDGIPKLLDFGIAKMLAGDAVEEPGLTQSGVRPMSPAHAAPEQVLGQPITTATDVYALGVILYELIAERGPYGDQLTGHALEDAILHTTPARPSAIGSFRAGRFGGDLDNIVLMALRKEPDRRYPSAGAFAEDIRRLLGGHPVRATRDSAGYRLRKFVGRNRAAVAATAAGLLLTGGSIGWYTGQLRDQRAQAQLEADKAGQVATFLQGIFTASDPGDLNRDAPAALDRTAGQLLASAVSRIDTALTGQPAVRASLLSVLGQTYRSLGEYRRAVGLLERADSSLALAAKPDPVLQAQVDNALGSAYWELGDLGRAAAVQRRAYDQIVATTRPDDYVRGVAANDLANILWQGGDAAAAEPLMDEAVRIFRKSGDPDDPSLATAIGNRAGILRELGRIDEAEALYREAIDAKRRSLGPDHPGLATSLGQLASLLLQDRGDAAGAEALDREALAIRRKALGDKHPYVAVSLNELAAALQGEGKLDEAEATYRQALALRREVYEPGHPYIAYSLVGLADLLVERHRPAEAEPLLREALSIRTRALPADHWLIGETESRLGRCLVLVGRATEGVPLMEHGHAMLQARFGPGDRRTRAALARLDAPIVPAVTPTVETN